MKKFTITLSAILLTILHTGCSTNPVEEFETATLTPNTPSAEPEDQEPETPEPSTPNVTDEQPESAAGGKVFYGSFNYAGPVPGLTSKVPACKDGEVTYVQFELLDDQSVRWISNKPVMDRDGTYLSEIDSLPIGNYRIDNIWLLSAQNDTLYAVPTQADTEVRDYVEGDVPNNANTSIADFADIILPIDITLANEITTVEATAFCNDIIELPVPGTLGGGINTGELMTVPIYITGKEDKGGYTNVNGIYIPDMDLCVDYFTVTVDGYRTPERYTWSQFNQYHITIPKTYGYFAVHTYDLDSDNPNAIESRQFGPNAGAPMYDPEIHGALVFDECDE